MRIENTNIQLSKIVANTGQIDGVPSNPIFIRDEKYLKLLDSLKAMPELLKAQPALIFGKNRQNGLKKTSLYRGL
jgi:hypothetical protein